MGRESVSHCQVCNVRLGETYTRLIVVSLKSGKTTDHKQWDVCPLCYNQVKMVWMNELRFRLQYDMRLLRQELKAAGGR